MAAADLINLSGLMDDAKCFAFVRHQHWPEGVRYPRLQQRSGDPRRDARVREKRAIQTRGAAD